jgi:hypothetical protein
MPECSSDDAVIGSDGSLCASCPRSKFDDASGRQPCKAIREIMFLRSGHTVPNIIPLPPSSIEAARRYTTRLASFGLPVHAVVTRIALEKANNKKGVAFARATFTCVGNLTGEQRSELKAYMQIIRPRTVDVMRPVTSSGEAEGEVIET